MLVLKRFEAIKQVVSGIVLVEWEYGATGWRTGRMVKREGGEEMRYDEKAVSAFAKALACQAEQNERRRT